MKNKLKGSVENKPSKYYIGKLKSGAEEAARDNVSYLQQATGRPITESQFSLTFWTALIKIKVYFWLNTEVCS